jgi:hypothetical protein
MLNHNLANKILNKYWKNKFNQVLSQINKMKYQVYSNNTSYLTIYDRAYLRYIFHYDGRYLEFEKCEGKINKHWSNFRDEIEWWTIQKDREIADNLNFFIYIMRCFNY